MSALVGLAAAVCLLAVAAGRLTWRQVLTGAAAVGVVAFVVSRPGEAAALVTTMASGFGRFIGRL